MIKLHVGSFRVRSIRTSSLTARILLACLCIVFQLSGGASAQEFRASKLAAPITALSLCKGIGDYQSAGFTCVSQQRPFDLNDKIWFKIIIKNLSSNGRQVRHVYYRAKLGGSVDRGEWVESWKKVRENLGPTLRRGDSEFYMRAHKNLAPGVWKAEIFVGNSGPSVIEFCIKYCPTGDG